jgi:type I site-specific restriction endonuclease
VPLLSLKGIEANCIADYILVYKGVKLAVVEAKSDELEVGEGVAQAKLYAQKLNLETTYSTNGNEIYQRPQFPDNSAVAKCHSYLQRE